VVSNAKKILCLIPARGGSKGLPRKNILPCAGKPLIAWTIEAALNAKAVDYVLVSTDCEEIAGVASDRGASVPYLRPAEISQDDSSMVEVVEHAIQWVSQSSEMIFSTVIVLQPTSPLRTSEDIDKAIDYYFENRKTKNDTLVSVSSVDRKYGWMMKERNGYGDFCFDVDVSNPRRQSLDMLHLPNGAFFIAPFEGFSGFYCKQTLLYEYNLDRAIDVDVQGDLRQAENLLLKGV
jgi:CMP-N,N'-diacetyllegionaminic acid synthase